MYKVKNVFILAYFYLFLSCNSSEFSAETANKSKQNVNDKTSSIEVSTEETGAETYKELSTETEGTITNTEETTDAPENAVCPTGTIKITKFGDGTTAIKAGKTCQQILDQGYAKGNGIYWIAPAGTAFEVYCDMTSDDGGWTLLAKRVERSVAYEEDDIINIDTAGNKAIQGCKADEIVAASSKIFRLRDVSINSMYIMDQDPIRIKMDNFEVGYFGNLWASNAKEVGCTNDYQKVSENQWNMTGERSVNCSASGIGNHICGSQKGWLLVDEYERMWLNYSGEHPCPIPNTTNTGAIKEIWIK